MVTGMTLRIPSSTLHALKQLLSPLELQGEWEPMPNGVWLFRAVDRAILGWSLTKKTVWFQGPAEPRAALEAKVRQLLGVPLLESPRSAADTTPKPAIAPFDPTAPPPWE
jgi:hypothetical protein